VIKVKNAKLKRGKNQFVESSGLIPLTSNPGAGAFDRDFLSVSVPSHCWFAGPCGDGCCPSLLDSFGGESARVFEPKCLLDVMGCLVQAGSLNWSSQQAGL
jgi:hypothetical protein